MHIGAWILFNLHSSHHMLVIEEMNGAVETFKRCMFQNLLSARTCKKLLFGHQISSLFLLSTQNSRNSQGFQTWRVFFSPWEDQLVCHQRAGLELKRQQEPFQNRNGLTTVFWQITFTFFQLLVLVQSVLCKLSSPSTQWSDDTSLNPSLKLTWHVTFDYTHPSTSDLSLSNFALCGNGSPCLLVPRSPTKVLEEEREASRTAQVCPLIAFDVSTFTLNKMCFLYNPIK